jgi:hypothetical protein
MSEQVSEPYFRVGEGKISGWISVILGALSVLGVLCFHFPDYLTTPQLAPLIPPTRCAICSTPG